MFMDATEGPKARYRTRLLGELGVVPESPAAEFLAEMADEAVEVLSVSDTDFTLTGEAYKEYQYNANVTKARKIGIIFRDLLEGLGEAGVDIKKLDNYCETQVRPGISIASTEDDKEKLLSVAAEFDRQLARQGKQ